MRIVHVVPGAGDSFYCQNCLRDLSLVRALRARGHDVVVAPMYLPMRSDHPDVEADTEIFYGAVGLYLKEKAPLLRKAPRWIQRVLDSPRLLAWASRKSGSTRSADLVDLTVSMLRGEEGRQAGELDRLVAWLRDEGRPDVVHLSNALLLGLARRIKGELSVPIVCSLQDEDSWVDAMGEEDARRVWGIMTERAADVDAFVSVSRYYADVVAQRMEIPADRLHVVYMGIDLEGFDAGALPFDPPVVGYLSRVCESLGAGLLAEAFAVLKKDERFAGVRLGYAGGATEGDRRFLKSLQSTLEERGLRDHVDFLPRFDRASRIEFLRSVSVLSVPVPRGEALGMHLLEAMASGVPVVQPRLGGATELVETTGGGILYEPHGPEALAEALAGVLSDPDRARQLGSQGARAVRDRFGVERMAAETADIYERVSRS